MKVELKKTEINFKNLPSDELIEYISFKDEFPEDAEKAFIEFCDRFQVDVLQKAEIYSNKYGYSSVTALDIANCTFNKVWKYHSFDKNKAKAKDIDTAIKLWLYPIVFNELMKYGTKDTCSEPDEDDLDIVENIDALINVTVGEDIENKRDLKIKLEILEKAMLGLSDKHKIIYLTYKAYENNGKNIPRPVSKKLKEKLNLVSSSIRVYKKEANLHVNNYLKSLNGNR
ncbi:RNA polymerase subunit sigma [Elizabethkingia anophelis]|uniref:RNA polymerase subunit sigma n=1 Tax=Elizabethkingia anophelis TaxID=1117645 RepID=UPI0021A3F701|nr:sigma-70 family RNA polymerase sigma factor [Elizabethkingia anophelis]MCT3828388.1 sigma-70 family RNA polymerase sigma factor [Elizabethkingia anophelis]MCT3839231.1 sigma-70 family RNA polymerase sigma factor [Elizabethkingia anophelis]MCT3842900.1 sigma-70 family RNA polymerase sigma factor [Elizabethkingia anophelis]MCT3850100.1 sigma-70 family RNA polymerase sigma factor [Elizabethkingia anophelis]